MLLSKQDLIRLLNRNQKNYFRGRKKYLQRRGQKYLRWTIGKHLFVSAIFSLLSLIFICSVTASLSSRWPWFCAFFISDSYFKKTNWFNVLCSQTLSLLVYFALIGLSKYFLLFCAWEFHMKISPNSEILSTGYILEQFLMNSHLLSRSLMNQLDNVNSERYEWLRLRLTW